MVGINRNNIANILLIVLFIFVLHFVDGDFLGVNYLHEYNFIYNMANK